MTFAPAFSFTMASRRQLRPRSVFSRTTEGGLIEALATFFFATFFLTTFFAIFLTTLAAFATILIVTGDDVVVLPSASVAETVTG